MQDAIKEAAREIAKAKNLVVLSGAGISVESGIPPFRGPGGLWEKIDPMKYANVDYFLKNPAEVWQVLIKDMKEVLDQARPNNAHLGLARLEKLGILTTIITQNVDGLHQKAGNTDVIEFHGTFAWQYCLDCSKRIPTSEVNLSQIPPHCECGGILRPDCVFFGEMIPTQDLYRSQQLSACCDIMLVIGTSALVQPSAHIPVIAKNSGAKVIEINPEKTPLSNQISDLIIMGKAVPAMNSLMDEIDSFQS